MKYFLSLAALSTIALAAPNGVLNARQGINSNDLRNGCQPAIFIMARGSTEAGNMVRISSSSLLRR